MLNTDFTDRIRVIAEEKDYGREKRHIHRVRQAATEIYSSLSKNGVIDGNIRDMELLTAICCLHDVGVKVEDGELGAVILPDDDHNVRSFKWCEKRLSLADCADLLTAEEKASVEYCVLWHKGNAWALSPDVAISGRSLPRARLLGGILRVGDSLASSFGKKKPEIGDPSITASCADGVLTIEVQPVNRGELEESDLDKAVKRKDLLLAALAATAYPRITDIAIKLR